MVHNKKDSNIIHYHRDIGFPEIDIPFGKYDLEPTNHAQIEAQNDKYGSFNLPEDIHITEENIIELEIYESSWGIKTILIREPYNSEYDRSLRIDPEESTEDNLYQGKIVTGWLNPKDFNHRVENSRKYVEPITEMDSRWIRSESIL